MTTSTRRPTNGNGNGTPPDTDGAVDAERALLGAMLLTTEAARDAAAMCAAEDLSLPSHQHVFATIVELTGEQLPVDYVTVADRLERQGLLDQCGGLNALITLTVSAVSSNATRYARIVAERAQLRRLAIAAEEVRILASTGDGHVDDIATRAALLIGAAANNARTRRRLISEHDQVTAAARGQVPLIVPTLLRRSDGQALLYPGLTNAISAEPGRGKTMIALAVTVEALNANQPVLWLDYESTPYRIGERLAAIGVDSDMVAEHLTYIRPPAIGPAERAELIELAESRQPTLAVLDGMARAIARQGGDEDKAVFVLELFEQVVHPLTQAGASVLLLDHVTKSKDGRGRWARGSGSKLGEIEGVAYGLEVDQSWSRTTAGRARMIVAKDREGVVGAEGDVAAVVKFMPTADGLRITLDPPEGLAVECAAVIVKILGERGGEVNRNGLVDLVRSMGHQFRDSTISETAERLAAAGRIRVRSGARKARLYSASDSSEVQDQF